MRRSIGASNGKTLKPDFFYYLDALLVAARSVTEAFKKEFHDCPELMRLHEDKEKKWKNDSIMRFCKNLRDIVLENGPNVSHSTHTLWRHVP